MNNDFLNYKFSKENKLIIENTDHHKLKIIADESANLKILEYISWSFKKPYKVKWEQSDRFNVILEEKFTNHRFHIGDVSADGVIKAMSFMRHHNTFVRDAVKPTQNKRQKRNDSPEYDTNKN